MCERVLPVKSHYVRRTRAFFLQPQSFYIHFYLFHSICFCICLSSWFWNPTYKYSIYFYLAGPGEIVYVHKKALLSNWLSINGHFIYAQNTTTCTCILYLHSWIVLRVTGTFYIENDFDQITLHGLKWTESNAMSSLLLFSSLIAFDLIWLKFDMVLEMHSIFRFVFQLSLEFSIVILFLDM